MRTIYRYEVPVDDEPTTLKVPAVTGQPLLVAARTPGTVEVWFEVDTHHREQALMTFRVIGTGHPAPEGGTWVGSTLAPLGLVWHLWRV